MQIKQFVVPAIVVALTACANTQAPPAPDQSVERSTLTPTNVVFDNSAAPSERSSEPVGEKSTDKNESDSSALQPRIIKGNDRVIGTPKAFSPLESGTNSFSFEDAPISEVVHVMMRNVIKADYVLHQPVAGSVTLSTKGQVSADQAMGMLEAALQTNGLAIVRDTRGVYHIGKLEALKNIGAPIRVMPNTGSLPPGYGTIIVPLRYIGAAEMATILRPMMRPDSLVRVDNLRNLLVLAGTRTQAEGWLDLVNTFDVDLLKGMSVGVFPLKYASIKEVEAALALVSAGTGGAGPSSADAPKTAVSGAVAQTTGPGATPAATLGEANPLFGALRVMPIERLNSILVVTPRAEYLEEARRWIEKLDQPSENNAEPQLFIYQVQNVNARHLATVLSGIFGGQGANQNMSSSTGVAPGLSAATGYSTNQRTTSNLFGGSAVGSSGTFGRNTNTLGSTGGQASGLNQGNSSFAKSGAAQAPVTANLNGIRVMADELNNSVLIWSTKAEYAKIEATLKRIDLPLTQVLIEATIVEVTLNDDLKYGLEWAFSDTRGRSGYTGSGLISGDKVNNGVLGSAATQGFTYTLSNSLGQVRAVLNALATKSLIKVISSPSLMVLDNHTATINVGDQQPIQTSVTSFVDNANASTSTIQYKDTGVNLVVTPSVNSANVVTMQVDQTVTDVGPIQASAGGQPSFLQRQISSKVAVRSGETIVLGGLIKDNQSTGKSGVPFLQDIPLVGKLFGTNTAAGNRTELLVVITPRVVRSDVDIRQVSEDLRARMQGLKRIGEINGVTPPRPLRVPTVPPAPVVPSPDSMQLQPVIPSPDAAAE